MSGSLGDGGPGLAVCCAGVALVAAFALSCGLT